MQTALTYRGELRCFACARYLGEFESHPLQHGPRDIHLLAPAAGAAIPQAVVTDRGLRCPVCGGRVIAEHVDREAAFAA